MSVKYWAEVLFLLLVLVLVFFLLVVFLLYHHLLPFLLLLFLQFKNLITIKEFNLIVGLKGLSQMLRDAAAAILID